MKGKKAESPEGTLETMKEQRPALSLQSYSTHHQQWIDSQALQDPLNDERIVTVFSSGKRRSLLKSRPQFPFLFY